MPRILILGATGYVGKILARFLVQEGQHAVYGVARSPEKADQLAKEEIIPVLCPDPVNEPEPYLSAIHLNNIDIVVDIAGASQGSHAFLRDISRVGQQRLTDNANRGVKGPKLGFIYCSGTWVHGSSRTAVSDLDLIGEDSTRPSPKLVRWRVDLENAILNSSEALDVMILRPALIYGRELTIWSSFITPLLSAARTGEEGPVHVPLDPQSRPGLVHVDDAAKGFQAAIKMLPLVSGTGVHPVFDLVTSQESMRDIFDAMAVCWGFRGKLHLVGPGDDQFATAMSTSFRGTSARAQQILGWQPSRLAGFVKDMDLYLAAFATVHAAAP
jgi:nucleoside-diphosphate-sugar epimerase